MSEKTNKKISGDKKKVANILLITGVIQILFNFIILPRFYGTVLVIKRILGIFIVIPGWFISLLANSGMSSVPAKRNLYDILFYHLFQIPGFIVINLMYYYGK